MKFHHVSGTDNGTNEIKIQGNCMQLRLMGNALLGMGTFGTVAYQ